MATALDLTRRHFSRTLGQITIIGTWIQLADGWRPCLVLIRTGEDHAAVPCIVPLESAWVWDDRSGEGSPAVAARTAMDFARALRLDDAGDPFVPHRIATLIADHLDQLVAMPPAPADDEVVIGEAVVTERETGRTFEVEIRE